ncbi:conserved hypothetical protein [Trichinella spiralis]|uniref:hypothetical protein n=1 Tax=Trichinella spiralis TaxID=6334 RepID=UPI0001EFB63D|nr:conserved hypothetical protein [Trichinella spiralis]
MAEVDVVDVPLATVDEDIEDISASQLEDATGNDISDQLSSCSMNSSHNANNKKQLRTGQFDIDSFQDSFSDSLEDLWWVFLYRRLLSNFSRETLQQVFSGMSDRAFARRRSCCYVASIVKQCSSFQDICNDTLIVIRLDSLV